MGNEELKQLPIEEELAKHESKSWDTVRLNDLSRFLGAIVIVKSPGDAIKLISGIHKGFEPTTKELIESAILEDFSTTWQGYVESSSQSENPEPFYRLMIDQIKVRKEKFVKLKKSPGNLIMLIKFYISLGAISFFFEDKNLCETLNWLGTLIRKIRMEFLGYRQSIIPNKKGPPTTLTEDEFTGQQTWAPYQSHIEGDEFTFNRRYREHIVEKWEAFLMKSRKTSGEIYSGANFNETIYRF